MFSKTALFVLAFVSLTGCGVSATRSSKSFEPGFHGGLTQMSARDPEPPAAANYREPVAPAVPERTHEPRVREIQCWQCQ